MDIVSIVEGLSKPAFEAWKENEDGSFTRLSQIPAGMSFEQTELAACVAPVRTNGEYMRLTLDL